MGDFVDRFGFDSLVFIMIRYRDHNAQLISALKKTALGAGHRAILASDHNLTDDLYNPVACLLCCSKGIAIFDEAEPGQVFNPNVAYELGMMHLLGRDTLILKHSTVQTLHTDVLMKLYRPYETPVEAKEIVAKWLAPPRDEVLEV